MLRNLCNWSLRELIKCNAVTKIHSFKEEIALWYTVSGGSVRGHHCGGVTPGLIDVFCGVVGEKFVSSTDAVREQHGHDESHHDASLPDLVVFPANTDEVSKVMRVCFDNDLIMIPFGSGTGLEGGVNAEQGGVSVCLNRLEDIHTVNAEDFDCTIGAGVSRKQLNNYLRDTGLWFPVDPGADASLCGMCSTSASGTNAVRYGTMRENVLNLEVVLADGRVLNTSGKGKRSRKTAAGYNLTNLFVGSEGTLGAITKATLRLYGIPEDTATGVCHFPNVKSAIDTTVQVLQTGIPIARIEFLDDIMVDACNKHSGLDLPVTSTLLLEFHGSPSTIASQVQIVEEICSCNESADIRWLKDRDDAKELWKARHDIVYACTALRPGSKVYSTDVCVPITNLPEIVVRTKEDIEQSGVIGPIVGHVGDGNFHVFFPVFHDNTEEMKIIHGISERLSRRAIALNGTCTGEHGIGMGKRHLLVDEIGDVGIEVMKQVKAALDPKKLMNPTKVFLS